MSGVGQGQRRRGHHHTEQRAPHAAMVPVLGASRMGTMGFNPYRKYHARPADYVLLATVFVIAIGLLIWALAG